MVSRPNVVVIVTDDQGYGDLSCMGSVDVKTPNLDGVAASGVRFTDFYSNSPVCTPSRAALLSGRYPARAGVRSILRGRRGTPGLRTSVTTLPRMLSDLGYASGLFGKWHLGSDKASHPQRHGFDEFRGFLTGTIDYFSHIHYADGEGCPTHDWWHGDTEVWIDGSYATDVISDDSVDFISRNAASGQPFYLHVAYNAPHYPMHTRGEYRERFRHLPWDRQIMAAKLAAVDHGVGRLIATLEGAGVRDDTIIVFMSDNGPSREVRNWLDGREDTYYGGSTGKLRGHKFSLFEGGIRVPGIISYPRRVAAGSVSSTPFVAMDVLPTVLGLLGETFDPSEFDGSDLSLVLTEEAPAPERAIFWEQGDQTAVRLGRWKLILNGQLEEHVPPASAVHLSDLDSDIGERHNLAEQQDQVVGDLSDLAIRWRSHIEELWRTEWLPLLPDYNDYTCPAYIK